MKILPLFLLLFLFACNNARQIQQEPEPMNGLSIPTLPDIKAAGHEPGWMLEIEFAKSMRFKSFGAESFELLTPVPVGQETKGKRIYRSETEKGTLEVRISKEYCMDVMSGKSFAYKVEVSAKTKEMPSLQEFWGCGQVLGDYRLNDIWVLRQMNREKIDPEDFVGGSVPYLELHLRDSRMMGKGGCNRISSDISIEDQQITFGPIFSTKMACPQLDIENKFTTILSGQTLRYNFQGLLLFLENEENELVFQKVD